MPVCNVLFRVFVFIYCVVPYHCTFGSVLKPSFSFSEVCSTDLSCFVSRSETNVARIAVRGDNGFVINTLALRAGEVGSTEVEPSGSRPSGVENESFINEEKGRNPPFDFESEDGGNGTPLERKRFSFGTLLTFAKEIDSLRAIERSQIGI
ncbi:hypothetical protein T12_6364 [Trichinella patagoniensis]|uniref:Uncharacterized protein n=1 Tax=Trichinella patagoniensis TaxID=990121 RepID=A0A0V0ZH16_9BILA|nr:hypothetical protein T12_6364 [Trichinella patagoniensis]